MFTDEDSVDIDEALFQPDGHWREFPVDCGDPQAILAQRQFFEVLEACMDHLPPTQCRVFMMREWLELDTKEVCATLGITSSNLWVMLHRARLRLMECLRVKWFNVAQPQSSAA